MIASDVFWDRMIFMAIGGFIGLLIGLLIKIDREAKEACREAREAHEEMHEWLESHKDESGQSRWHNVALIFVIGLVVYAVFASQAALNSSSHQADCTQSTVVESLNTLNERSTYTVDNANANKDLQVAQAAYIELVLKYPQKTTQDQLRTALNTYFDALNDFTSVAVANAQKLENNPIPTSKSYEECLNE